MHPKIKIPFQKFITILAVNLNSNGRRNILTYLVCLIFILLNLNESFAYSTQSKPSISFAELNKKIQKKDICEIKYNPSKTAAIVNVDCGSAYYINFKTQQTYMIINHWPNVFPAWISDTIAHIEGPCGTGCSKSIIFVAPATMVSCATHEYRVKNLTENEPPDFYNNRPLLIDPKKEIYVCYDDENNIQVFPLPTHASIHPPKNYFSEKAEIRNGQLVVTYKNGNGKVKRIPYGKI
ncbi:MAG TPA: hypothetical protein VJN02_00020 [Gammaproteobacteria bacterium]|nr:hypothetical protein [Gammaproteobacteria bacterium]